jgi:hypothetical protein
MFGLRYPGWYLHCPILRQPKSAAHKQVAKLFLQHWRRLKGNYELNFAFEMSTVSKAYRRLVSL